VDPGLPRHSLRKLVLGQRDLQQRLVRPQGAQRFWRGDAEAVLPITEGDVAEGGYEARNGQSAARRDDVFVQALS
jgi:hypothetical protein